MNKIKTKIGIAALLAMMAVVSASAQATNSSPTTVPTFFTSAEQYLTSFNTNYTFQGVTFEAATGYKQVTGVGAASVVDAQYDINRFHIVTSFQFSGVGSAVNAEEGGIGYDIVDYCDTVLEANLLGGYDENIHSAEIEPKVDIKKKQSYNTFSEIGISMPVYFKQKFNNTPSFYIEEGFTF
jgi:hypothetical protein